VTVEVRDNPAESRYEIREDEQLAGFVQYRLHEKRITFVHTEIDAAHSGHGLATKIARVALDDARRRGLAVVPRCSFIASFIRSHADEYLPLVLPALREPLMHQGDRA
jgi:predicted GNAT family acetyltransferase